MRPIHIINGPNLNLLGFRNQEIYGNRSFDSFLAELRKNFPDVEIHYFQSNSEGILIDELQRVGFKQVGIIFNPAAYTHTSIAIADTLEAISAPIVEVHISDLSKRESIRHFSLIRPFVTHHIEGLGLDGYRSALEYLLEMDT